MFSFNSSTTISKRLVKLSAYEALLECNVSKLPVDLIKIFNTRKDVSLYNSTLFFESAGWCEDEYIQAFGTYGTLIYSEDFEKYFAYYNDFNPEPVIRWELSSLLALLELDLVSPKNPIRLECNKGDYTETFSYYFTAPDIILSEIGIKSAEEVMKSCKIPFDKAHAKGKKLKLPWVEKKTYLDKLLKSNFDNFIELHKK